MNKIKVKSKKEIMKELELINEKTSTKIKSEFSKFKLLELIKPTSCKMKIAKIIKLNDSDDYVRIVVRRNQNNLKFINENINELITHRLVVTDEGILVTHVTGLEILLIGLTEENLNLILS